MTRRYSKLPLPAYAWRPPGPQPHPRRSPLGHSFASPEPHAQAWTLVGPAPPAWLYGVDLFNRTFWWEAHEQWEALWNAVPRESTQSVFIQGMIQVAAAYLNRLRSDAATAGVQARKGLARTALALVDSPMVLGLEVAPWNEAVRRDFQSEDAFEARIDLRGIV